MSYSEYLLKSKDKPLIRFKYFEDSEVKNPDSWISIQNIYTENLRLIPKDLVLGSSIEANTELAKWFEHRKIPIERKYVEKVINIISDPHDPLRYIKLGRGLSLNDAYWVSAVNDPTTWEDCNLYANKFNELIAELVFAEKNAYKAQNLLKRLADYVKNILDGNNKNELKIRSHISSPEFTTNGNMRKCWVCKPDGIYLRKAEDNDMTFPDGRSPVSMEFYAYQVAEAMGIPFVPYTLSNYMHGDGTREVVCECPLFTSENVGFISALNYFKDTDQQIYKGMVDPTERKDPGFHLAIAEKFGKEFYEDMMIYDTIILNFDRHFSNFGYLIDNNSGEYLTPAPLFDNGSSKYWARFGELSIDNVIQYLHREVDDDDAKFLSFGEQANVFVRPRHEPMLEKLANFQFKQPDDISSGISVTALEALNYAVQLRSNQVLEILKNKEKEREPKYFYFSDMGI